jgi:hypothetical protein
MVSDHGRKPRWGIGFSCHVCLLRPNSRGSVWLQGADPMLPPAIDPNFLGEEDDLETMVAGFKLTRRLLDASALRALRTADVFTEGVETDDDIRQVLRNRVDTVYHPVGTCKMGVNDPLAVVDPTLKVHGTQGLRVVDASIMPTLIGGNTNAHDHDRREGRRHDQGGDARELTTVAARITESGPTAVRRRSVFRGPKFDDGVRQLGFVRRQAREIRIAPIRNVYDPRGLSACSRSLVRRLDDVQSVTVEEERVLPEQFVQPRNHRVAVGERLGFELAQGSLDLCGSQLHTRSFAHAFRLRSRHNAK